MLKPFDPYVIGRRVMDLSPMLWKTPGGRSQKRSDFFSLDERITEILLSAGIPAHIKGYYFLREAVKAMIRDPDIINAITKELYPAVARCFNTSPLRVERAICHAINAAWSKGRMKHVRCAADGQFRLIRSKPTNGKFIALVADLLPAGCAT
jgi:two-component system response regulator (stage 0 sporulation protein A)